MLNELVVISGKGGTGKTSIVACFAALAEKSVMADCDVDAADLHLILNPEIKRTVEFSGGSQAKVISGKCMGCGKCAELCRFDAIEQEKSGDIFTGIYRVDPISCEGCGVCAHFCPAQAIEFKPAVNGEWYISHTRFGPLVHAKLGIAEENSGKLVATVRKQAKKIAEEQNLERIIIDGSPGIGCPVIASITGASEVLIVTEPTLSGRHDMKRVAGLVRHFNVPASICVNKWDINADMTEEIEKEAVEMGLTVAGRVRYDRQVTESQILKQALVEMTGSGASEDIRNLWNNIAR